MPEAARVLGTHEAAIYPWIRSGEMTARQTRHRRWCIALDNDIEAYWKQRVATSSHLKRRANTNYETG
ncbi:hypothetical protein [Streptomyces sp. NPDC003998]